MEFSQRVTYLVTGDKKVLDELIFLGGGIQDCLHVEFLQHLMLYRPPTIETYL